MNSTNPDDIENGSTGQRQHRILHSDRSRSLEREFGTEADVAHITGRSVRTLQKDRLLGTGFPFYRYGRMVRYDLKEIRELLRAGRVAPGAEGRRCSS